MTPRIGLALGDPGGIGPEIAAKALGRIAALPDAAYIVFGDIRLLEAEAAAQAIRLDLRPWTGETAPGPGLYARETEPALPNPVRGVPDAGNGEASFAWFRQAVEAAERGGLEAVVTAPISKTSWSLAGIPDRGHTEYLERSHPKAIMSFWSDRLRVALLSHHLPLREALERVRKPILAAFLRTLWESLSGLPDGPSELLVAGLNPHAGETGLLGSEESDEIEPALREVRAEGIRASGPFPPDTVFLQALGRPDRMVAALYHDQGLIGFKLAAFATGVNVTLGLPFVRTSPDHGTAFDIAGQGVADPASLVEALRLAVKLSSPQGA